MLKWAREWRGRSLEESGAKVDKPASVINGWETNIGAPTVRQARILADFYDRPFLEFFLSEPPEIEPPRTVPDFRTYVGEVVPTENWELKQILQWSETQRENALELFSQIDEEPPQFPEKLFANTSTDVEALAMRVREFIKLSFSEQVGNSQRNSLHDDLREKIEQIGILTLRRTTLRKFGVRGICIAEFPLPVVVFGNEAPTAQAFTMAHELGHILLRESGITGFRSGTYQEQPVENWCDRFAAAFLMLKSDVVSLLGVAPKSAGDSLDDSLLKKSSRLFGVSEQAMLIRLVHLGYVSAAYYWDTKKPQYDAEDARFKQYGRAKYYGSRFKGKLGDLYTSLVIQAWDSDRITNHKAAEYMGLKGLSLSHLYDIRQAVRHAS